MKSSFVAYVDESGDEGFKFRLDGSGSSKWLVLSAVVVRRENDLALVECLKNVRTLLGKPPKYALHFVDLRHEQRVPYIRRVGQLPIRTVTVLVYKPLIAEKEKFENTKYLLYRYATRLLLERVSWLCRDHRRPGEGDGFCEVIFSNRSNMSYEEIRDYLRVLASQADMHPESVQVDSTVIDPARIRSVEHSKLAGLQIADAVASGFHFATRQNRYGETEEAYLSHLAKTIYRHRGVAPGYGVKAWPGSLDQLTKQAPEAKCLEGL